jgi:hypothetical protein
MCDHERENPFVYKLPNGEVYIDFRLEERFSVREWLELVDTVNRRVFALLMNNQRRREVNDA